MNPIFARLAEELAIDRFALALAGRLVAADGAASDADSLALAAVLAHEATRAGDTCCDLALLAGSPLFADRLVAPAYEAWRAALERSPMVAIAREAHAGVVRPLVIDDAGRLYLHRYWHYEQSLARTLRERAAIDPAAAAAPDPGWLEAAGTKLDPSQRAAARRMGGRLLVIAGGPGAGKTRTVAYLIAALLARHGAGYRIGLAAPTGKAAARLQDSLEEARGQIALPEALAAAWPREVRTLHRLLGPIAGSSRFRHDAAHPLALDCLVVDEASMVDLALAAKVAAALPAAAALVLLGDPDQLASVEAGAVLASVCAQAAMPGAALARSVVRLTGSHRFGAGGALARLAQAVRAGDIEQAAACVAAAGDPTLVLVEPQGDAADRLVVDGFAPYAAAVRAGSGPVAVLAALERFRVLAGERHGAWGTNAINARVGALLDAPPARFAAAAPWYAGRAVIVTANDYSLGLFNGDVGVALPDAAGALRVYFRDRSTAAGVRALAPARLPKCETAFALTVHRAQGSEFDRVLAVLPPPASRLATRELVYTAITRARNGLVLVGPASALAAAIGRRQMRRSGLADALQATSHDRAGA